ncbi:ParB/RepB/Spo0J family partition protein [Aquiluna borgnonia]|jgi:ParB family chromosome partitioning protein|uniref:ParB/RepB/Spo0J family partition protein n=1 Tax=Aquiluna borgnonia TaxID=2499157 RepID=A0A7D4U8D3_9MICO|nr:ParB/RepB/Spo0J family partition protein [Aquiluna borgnonia]QKJ25896.1 ParB/RepB/Spo0J family partition protein [Aquiluna borgnonia]
MTDQKKPERKGGLGRGIGSLIPGGDRDAVDVFFTSTSAQPLVEVPGARFVELNPADIVPNPQQPRSVFEPEAFGELVHSIRQFGVLQPIVVRPKGAGYELIMGERRLRASKEAGLAKIPAIVRETADENMLRDALLENLHRSNLNPLEEASAYKQMLEDFGSTQEELADRLGRSRPQITNTLRLLRLPLVVQTKVASGVISAGHARALLGAPDDQTMIALAERVIREGLSVRSLEEAVSGVKVKPNRGKIVPGGKTDMLKELADSLAEKLNTVVKIQLGRKKGQLVIEFGNVADLRRIISEFDAKN